MTWTAGILLTFGTAALCLDAYALRKAYLSKLYEPGQLWAEVGHSRQLSRLPV
jgi:hypothetical protein